MVFESAIFLIWLCSFCACLALNFYYLVYWLKARRERKRIGLFDQYVTRRDFESLQGEIARFRAPMDNLIAFGIQHRHTRYLFSQEEVLSLEAMGAWPETMLVSLDDHQFPTGVNWKKEGF